MARLGSLDCTPTKQRNLLTWTLLTLSCSRWEGKLNSGDLHSSSFHLCLVHLQIVSHGNFATVWLGTYQGSRVAVKVFPASWKRSFTAEKDIYELPLMRHSGIIHFLGTARKPYGDGWLIVLQFAENVSYGPTLRTERASWWGEPRYLQGSKNKKQQKKQSSRKDSINTSSNQSNQQMLVSAPLLWRSHCQLCRLLPSISLLHSQHVQTLFMTQ